MCGIFCKYVNGCENAELSQENGAVERLLACRGPDASDEFVFCSDNFRKLKMIGKTLWMQGAEPRPQPTQTSSGALLYNGDLFNTEWVGADCDTDALHQRLDLASNIDGSNESSNVISLLKTLNGPFAIIYLNKFSKKLYFCRDRIGRRSLLVNKSGSGFILSSVLTRKFKFTYELPVGKIYCFCLTNETITEFHWNNENPTAVHCKSLDNWLDSIDTHSNEILDFHPSKLNEDDSVLINMLENMAEKSKDRLEFLNNVLQIKSVEENVIKLISVLSESVKHRVTTQPNRCFQCVRSIEKCEKHSSLGILFSGGLDCTILAVLAHSCVPPEETIDLFNVSFARKINSFDTPDRISSQNSLDELQTLFPSRHWNLVEINVTEEELHEKQKEVIADLIYPLQTILDESLGSAIWFAARGRTNNYSSNCRILLTGLGADELFGGYTRHRNEFKRHGWANLEKELTFDWERIGYRNLGRDDRIISHHSRQPRMPYLDETFVKFALSLKPWHKCYPGNQGAGDKMILRLSALKLGLTNVAVLPKRAIQFGTKIALKNENAKDISQRLLL